MYWQRNLGPSKGKSEVSKEIVICMGDPNTFPMEGFEMDWGCYYQPWFRSLYYFCVIPFNVDNDGIDYFLTSSQVLHKIACIIVQISICIGGLLEVRGAISGTVSKDPVMFLRFLERINTIGYIFSFFYTVWFKKEEILALFGKPEQIPSKDTKKVRSIIWPLTIFMIIFSGSTFYCNFLSFDINAFDVRKGFHEHTQEVLFELYFPSNSSPREINPENFGKGVPIISSLSLSAWTLKWVLVDLLLYISAISALMSLRLANRFREVLTNSTNESYVFESYYKLKNIIENINAVFGPFYILVSIAMISFCAVRLGDFLDFSNILFSIIVASYFTIAVLMLLMAAESHHQISKLKTWILAPQRRCPETTAKYLEIDNHNLGLKGGPLFTITYGILGTASSVVLTYSILMIQFKGNYIYYCRFEVYRLNIM